MNKNAANSSENDENDSRHDANSPPQVTNSPSQVTANEILTVDCERDGNQTCEECNTNPTAGVTIGRAAANVSNGTIAVQKSQADIITNIENNPSTTTSTNTITISNYKLPSYEAIGYPPPSCYQPTASPPPRYFRSAHLPPSSSLICISSDNDAPTIPPNSFSSDNTQQNQLPDVNVVYNRTNSNT